MSSVWVDPERLRALADKATSAADTAQSAHVDRAVEAGCDGLPGSSLQWAAQQIGHQLGQQVTAYAESARGTAGHVAGAARDYRMTDQDAATVLNKAWPAQ
ncbi:type VII secretion target [uncultured Williamsia sp.]|uniref:type VII secretion target n=1 Tax=uncultured Williamsia sp. TaxID=259311 RepID=UPI00262ED0C4|nr:type VII secretion target [uncultured Williamsia sp.]